MSKKQVFNVCYVIRLAFLHIIGEHAILTNSSNDVLRGLANSAFGFSRGLSKLFLLLPMDDTSDQLLPRFSDLHDKIPFHLRLHLSKLDLLLQFF